MTSATLLDALADCLESGASLVEALAKVASVGGAASLWAERVKRSARPNAPVATALHAARVIDDTELALLSVDGADAMTSAVLRAVVLRRRRRFARRSRLLWSLLGPFGVAVLTVVLDPLGDVIGGGDFLWPVVRGLLLLVVVALGLVAGVPALFANAQTRLPTLRVCLMIPGAHWFAGLYAEEELLTALTPFVDGGEIRGPAFTAAASLLSWSPLGALLRAAARADRTPSSELAMGGLEPAAAHLSVATKLAVVGGVASKRLRERLSTRADVVSTLLTERLRLVLRVGAYAIIVALSLSSLIGIVSRGLPGMPTLPGGAASSEQKQLEELMKQLEQP